MNYPDSIQRLIQLFSKFPTIGPRTASRFVFYLLKSPEKEIKELSENILNLQKNIKQCSLCFNFFEPKKEETTCNICSDSSRDRSILCLVEKEADFLAIEKTNKYKGVYFVLGGTISVLQKKNVKRIRDQELKKRILKDPKIEEIIIATNSTTEGRATALYLEKILKPFNKKITKLARGLPVGGELEYADEETLLSALKQRK